MMNSDKKKMATIIVDTVFELLDEERLNRLINNPIEKAMASFDFNSAALFTHQFFIRVIGDFLRHLYAHGLTIRQCLSPEQAKSEAIAILETGYFNPNSKGFHAAFLDASKQENGLDFVLSQMAQFIIASTKEKYIRWIFASRIDVLPWATRCSIVEILLERWKPFLPSSLRECTPEQLSEYLYELMNVMISTDNNINNIRTTNINDSL